MSERRDHSKILSKLSEFSFAPSHSFCRCTGFWRGTADREPVAGEITIRQPQLCCHTRLSPSRILLCHLHDEFADVLRNSWPTNFRLPFPKQFETLAMPANQGLWIDDYQGLFPIAEARPVDETDTGSVVQSSRLDLSLLIESQLL